MSTTRFNSIGLTGRKDGTTNAVDSYKKIIEVPITIVASASAQATTIVLPAKSVVQSCVVNVITPEATGATKTLSVGIDGGSGTAFANAVSVAAAGFVVGTPNVAANAVTINYTLGSNDFAELDAIVLLEIIAADA